MSLQSKFVLDFTYEQPNYVPADFNLGLDRSARDQEVSNCWTYPTIFSFETDLIRQGLADQNVRGSEWNISTLHANSFRGWNTTILPSESSPNRYYTLEERDWGGHHWFGLQYLATGKSGAMVEVQDREVNRINDLLKYRLNKQQQVAPADRWPVNEGLDKAKLLPDSNERRSYGYDQAKLALTTTGTKKILKNDRIAGYISYFIPGDTPFDFPQHLDLNVDKDYGEWFTPGSFSFQDDQGQKYNIDKLLDMFLNVGVGQDFSEEQTLKFRDIINEGPHTVGGGHAVTVVGWDDQFKPTIVDNKNDVFFENYRKKFKKVQLNDPYDSMLESFSEFLSDKGIALTNRGSDSTGAWIVQNSWGTSRKQLERQYLPFDMADLDLDLPSDMSDQDLDKSRGYTLGNGAMFHYADQSRTFGNVLSASTAVPKSILFDRKTATKTLGVGFRFEASGEPIVAIGSILGFEGSGTSDPKTSDLTSKGFVQARLWDADEVLSRGFARSAPLAETPLFPDFYGYQTLEFTQPFSDAFLGQELIATFELFSESLAPELDSNKFYTYEINPDGSERLQEIANSGFTPDQPEYYKDIPMPLVKPALLDDLEHDTYFSLTLNSKGNMVLKDEGKRDSVIHLNVIHQKDHTSKGSIANGLDGFEILSDKKAGELVIGVNENRDRYKTPSRKIEETFFISSRDNIIDSGGKRDVFMLTEAFGRKNKFDSGSASDTLILSLGPNNAFQGRLTLKGADSDHLIIRGQDKLRSKLRRKNGNEYFDVRYPGARIKAFVSDRDSTVQVETGFDTDVTGLLEIGV